MKSRVYEVHTYQEKDRSGNRCYSYLVRIETKREINYLASMTKYKTSWEAKIAGTLLVDKNYLGK